MTDQSPNAQFHAQALCRAIMPNILNSFMRNANDPAAVDAAWAEFSNHLAMRN